jgi:uncharacterized protein YcnI
MEKRQQMKITSRRGLAAVVTAAVAGVLAFAAPASAHVSVQPGQATQGSYTKVSFRVPNERDNAGTVKLEVLLPEDKPLTSVQTRALPGWTATVEKAKLATPIESHGKQITEAASKITWTAQEGVRVAPGTFEDFEVSLGQLPKDTDRMVFKAVQTYDNGEVVRWIDVAAEGQPEPQYPAPVLKLAPANTAGTAATPAPAAQDGQVAVTTSSDRADSDDTTARTLGVAGLVVGVLGLATAAFAVARGPRRAASVPARPSGPSDE